MFVLCGVSVGMLTNLRIMGVMLYPAVLALRWGGVDLTPEKSRARKTSVSDGDGLRGGGFVHAAPTFAVSVDESVGVRLGGANLGSSRHQSPWWIISRVAGGSVSPSLALHSDVDGGLDTAGDPAVRCRVIVVILHSIRAPRATLGNTGLRFGLLLVACLTLFVLAIVVFGSHLYNN